MKISFIGMSGAGKSHWAKKLEEHGFIRFCCDDLLEVKLKNELVRLGFKGGIADVSAWMGQPYDTRYATTSKKYLALEKLTMHEVVASVKQMPPDAKIVIDTTGSVIYTGKKILEALSQLTTIIFLDTPDLVKKEMHALYLKDPKPVIWGKTYRKKAKETDLDALARCYPQLLAYRTKRYRKNAHKTLDYFVLRQSRMTSEDLLRMIST